jgi:hypothetical protein
MRQYLIAQHLHARRAGIDLFSVKPSDQDNDNVLRPDQPAGSKGAGGTWNPPRPSVASRKPAANSRFSCRGLIHDPIAGRAVLYESALERDLAYLLLTDRRIVAVYDQPPAVSYIRRDGRGARHTFDFLVETMSGARIAYAVKPLAKVGSSGIEETIALIRRQTGDAFADRFEICTEEHLPRLKVDDARLILRSRACRNHEDVRATSQVAAGLRGTVPIRSLVAMSGLPPARARNAVVNLIDEGGLELAGGTHIGDLAMVRLRRPAMAA